MNENRTNLITEARNKNNPYWARVASDLAKANRSRRIVNLSRIARVTKAGETILVPGKVLGTGELNHSLTIAAYNFSESAKKKLSAAKCNILTIQEYLEKHPKGGGRIIG